MTRFIAWVLTVLFALTFTIASAQSDWVKEVRTGKAESTPAKICENLHQFYKMTQPDRGLGITIARNLLWVVSLPWQIKSQFESCGAEGRYFLYFSDAITVMDTLVVVLGRAGTSPKDIGVTPAYLREALLKDLRAQFAEVRRVYQEGKASRSDYYEPLLLNVARRAIREWNFGPQELGLTADEVAVIKKK